MKLTKSKLKRIIKEELNKILLSETEYEKQWAIKQKTGGMGTDPQGRQKKLKKKHLNPEKIEQHIKKHAEAAMEGDAAALKEFARVSKMLLHPASDGDSLEGSYGVRHGEYARKFLGAFERNDAKNMAAAATKWIQAITGERDFGEFGISLD